MAGIAITPFWVIAGVTEEGIPQRHVSGSYYQATVGLQVALYDEVSRIRSELPQLVL